MREHASFLAPSIASWARCRFTLPTFFFTLLYFNLLYRMRCNRSTPSSSSSSKFQQLNYSSCTIFYPDTNRHTSSTTGTLHHPITTFLPPTQECGIGQHTVHWIHPKCRNCPSIMMGGMEGLKWSIWHLASGPSHSQGEKNMSPWPRVNQVLGILAFHTIA